MAILPLAGYTVAVTADRRRDEQVELLRRRGADVLEGPTVRTEPLADDSALRAGIDAVVAEPPAITVILTGLGVRSLLGAAESMGQGEALLASIAASDVYTRGPKATGAAVTAGIGVAWSTAGERSTELLAELSEAASAGARIAVQRDGDADPHLARALAAIGGDVVDIPVYRWSMPEDLQPAQRLLDAVCARSVDALTFTSSPSVRYLFDLAEEAGARAALLEAVNGPVVAVCVGPVCAETAKGLGIESAVVPKRARLGTMVQALAAELGGRARRLELHGTEVTIQGALAVVGDEEVRLTDRERAVLHALVDAGGAVVPKRSLLRDVWGSGTTDEHAVEVTVSRLRSRLGAVGPAIQTVPRRGYRLA
jgi:uroporphyrinogen-III synthase